MDHRGYAGFGGRYEAIGEGEERVGGDNGAFGQRLGQARLIRGFLRFPGGDSRRVHAAHLSGADPGGGTVLGIDNGVGFHVLGDFEREEEVGQLLLRRFAVGDDLEVLGCNDAGIHILHQKATRNWLYETSRICRIGQCIGFQDSHFILFRQYLEGIFFIVRCNNDLHEGLNHRLCGFGIQGLVHRQNPAKCADGIAAEGVVIRLQQVAPAGDAAGVGVFDDGDARLCKLRHQLIGRVRVVDIVVG